MTKHTLIAAVVACIVLSAATAEARPAPPQARAFAQRIVAELNRPATGPVGEWGVHYTTDWYDAGFVRLEEDSFTLAEAHNVAPPLEGDNPLCGCEHPSFRYRVGTISQRRDGVVTFQMRTFNGSDWSNHDVQLRQVGRLWRIWSIVDEMGDWRPYLTRFNACLRTATTQQAAERCGR
jgi:hypothetical protein